jgi:hypothetical protein
VHVHLLESRVRKILWTILGCWLGGLLAAAAAVSFPLADGTTVSGDIVSYTENGIIFRTGEDKYSDRLPWIKFSQAGLQQLAQNPKIEPLVEPFIEVPPPPPRPQKTDIKIGDVPRLERPASASLFGALFSSSVGLVVLLLIYGANLFAGYEIALFRAKPVALVMGVAAVLPILGPIIFLSMIPPRVEAAPTEGTSAETPVVASEPHRYAVPGSPPPDEIHIVASSWQASPDAAQERPQPQIFQRGMFMFNRRFFETKFSGFFSIVRTGADKEKVLLVKTLREQLVVERISRIAANDAHFEVMRGGVRQEIMVPFAEIQEIQVQPKEA